MTLDAEDIERIADAVAERLTVGALGAVRMVDAAAVAAKLGVDRHWVYAHAEALGAVRIGGPQGRLRFDLEDVLRRVRARDDQGVRRRRPVRRTRGRQRGSGTRQAPVELIPYDRLP